MIRRGGPGQMDTKRLLAVCLVAASASPPAAAQEWSIDGRFTQRFEADTNRKLDPDPDGAVFGAITRLNVDFGYATPRTDWTLSTGAVAAGYVGSGDTDGLNRLDPLLNTRVEHRGQRFVTGATGSFSRKSTSFVEFDEDGGIDNEGARISTDAVRTVVRVGGFWTFLVDARNSLTVSSFGRVERFSEEADDLEPSTSFGGRLSWSHQLDPLTSVSLQTGVQHFTADDDVDTASTNVDVSLGLTRALTPRLSLTGTAGVAATRRTEDEIAFLGIGPVVVPVVTGRESDYSVSGIGSLGFSYRMDDTTFQLSASQSVQPSSRGELQDRTALSFGIRHRLAPRHDLSFLSAVTRRTGAVGSDGSSDEDTILFQLSPTYSYRVTEDWDASVGYRFRLSDEDDGTAISNAIFFGFSRDLAIFP